jgi:predicted nucleic acid-binding Zn ribbon protein
MPPLVRRKKGVTGEGAVDISVLIAKVLDKAHVSESMDFKTLSDRFEEVVGKAVCTHVQPVKLDKHTLVLKAASAAWKSELFMQKNAIIDRCNALLGKPVVKAIRFV